MERNEILNKMREYGIKHYIVSATMESNWNSWYDKTITEGIDKCHWDDESFEKEIARLEHKGYFRFDVIHLH